MEVGNNLLFSNAAERDYDVLLLSHLDNSISFAKQSRYHETEQKLYGSAIWDSKGGLAVMIAALRALRFVRRLRKLKIGILLTSDNAMQGRITRNSLQDISRRAKAVIELSGASLDGTVITSRSGAAVYNCQMNLVNADNAENVAKAIASFSQHLASLTKLSSEADGVVVVPMDVRMQSGIATLFAHCEASLSLRFNNQEQAEAFDQKIRQIVRKMNSRKYSFLIEGGIRRSPMLSNEGTKTLYQRVKDIGNRLDLRVLEEHRWSSSDICSVNQDIARIDGLGPIGAVPHEHEEYILRHSLLDRAALLALLLDDLRRRK
ncbi:D-alanine-D-alanine ligase [Candidatus Methanophagaceae archaeon]|nr:D-alanine-D-alanine ligase [Methanophagales archaeon]